MSDKKTWTALKGVKIPGLTLLSRFTNLGGGRYQLSQDREVLNQLLEYAKCELAAIRECYKQVHAGMDEKDMVLNYHKGEEYDGHTIVQGARFGVLTGIYDEDGNWVSFNRIHEEGSKKYKNERDNINTAYEYFFGIPDKDNPGMYWVKTKAGDKDWSSRKYINESQLQEY
ncbi:MAG: hypothetical protein VZQ98_11470 [Bacteroidales bacterium]|nr:hypothetical protein [Bacteroidales bacterium]